MISRNIFIFLLCSIQKSKHIVLLKYSTTYRFSAFATLKCFKVVNKWLYQAKIKAVLSEKSYLNWSCVKISN